ncbi:periplasmic nitrate reductase, NapE protein [Azospirillum rugosum]|uniref:Nitrate reductase NapE n=1 Tax=Azospirillum rugosum TaxID=416170 RepID=A0ABS4STY4_9PROT|nr:periplasmic nitrate reductase, NapE protein [Azospirillum rugosum]MBP2296015.1 nitrate reductase NapE [Azospirillum rugosum]MDQ0529605.1 nitrate reductase NapE [Azospirillum rugosum]
MTAPHFRTADTPTRRFEGLVFLALSVLIWPVLAIGVVGAYGFSVWMYQLLSHGGGL